MPRDQTILDFSNPQIKKMVIGHIKSLDGLYYFDVKRCRNQRSLQANALYWGVILKAIQAGLREAWGETLSIDEVHLFMKAKFLEKPLVNRHTGYIQGTIPGSSAGLDTEQFAEYIEQVTKFGAEYLNIEIPPSKGW